MSYKCSILYYYRIRCPFCGQLGYACIIEVHGSPKHCYELLMCAQGVQKDTLYFYKVVDDDRLNFPEFQFGTIWQMMILREKSSAKIQ